MTRMREKRKDAIRSGNHSYGIMSLKKKIKAFLYGRILGDPKGFRKYPDSELMLLKVLPEFHIGFHDMVDDPVHNHLVRGR